MCHSTADLSPCGRLESKPTNRKAAGLHLTNTMPRDSFTSIHFFWNGQGRPVGARVRGDERPLQETEMPWPQKPQGATHKTPPAGLGAPRPEHRPEGSGAGAQNPQDAPRRRGCGPSAKDNGGDRSEMDRQAQGEEARAGRGQAWGRAAPGTRGGGDAGALTMAGPPGPQHCLGEGPVLEWEAGEAPQERLSKGGCRDGG